MSKPIKMLLIAAAVVIVLMLGIAVAVLMLFDPNEFREEIAGIVEERTGREFSIDGELDLRLFPCCAVAIDDTRLGNPAGFDEPDFASVKSVGLGLELLPLLFDQRVVVDEIRLEGLSVNLLKKSNGAANWEFDTGAAEAEPTQDGGGEASELPELSVAGVKIVDARIELRDDQAGTHVAIERLNVSTGPVAADQPIDIDVSLSATDYKSEAAIEGRLSSGLTFSTETAAAVLTGIDAKVDVTAAALPEAGANLVLQGGAVSADLNSGVATLEAIVANLAAAGVEIGITANGSIGGENATLSGTLDVPRFSPREVLAGLDEPPIETADPEVLQGVELEADWAVDGDMVNVDGLRMQLDDSSVTGKLSANYATMARTRFDLQLDEIDVDRYLAPAAEDTAGGDGVEAGETEIPVEALRGLDIIGRAGIGRMTMNKMVLQNVAAEINAQKGLISISPTTADVYGGTYEGSIRVDVAGKVPQVKVRQSLSKVQTGGLLADMYDAKNLEGLLEARIDGAGSGNTTTEIMQSLKGGVVLDLDEAVYKGADVWYEIRKAVARIKGKPAPERPANPQTQITALGFAGELADGILRSDKLVAEIPFIRVDGGGAFDLLQNNLDYRLKARMLSRPNFPDADDLADLQKITIPITVKGDATEPTIGIDLAELAKDAAAQKAKDRLLDKLGLAEPEEQGAAGEGTETDAAPAEKSDKEEARDLLKKGLRDLFD
ncbi:MAG: AsmA family protein [Gammaproteobacteria bacterium]|nr:AsmA family protein [Gammaproteobacteria bacterium]MBT8444183.1 AsmA family protein [Gammaproteobacteria bacterium]NND36925.1 AsmA family protein [Gammaproteobacteria bacterium]